MTTIPQTTRPKGWVWNLARLAIRTFYRVERVGERLPSGALLLLANHPNALLDPAVIQTTAGRQVRFLAKSTLFQRHPLSVLVRNSGAIPVYRRIDPGVDASRNVETFSAVESALAQGEVICLFPEGISHDHGKLEALRTGASRMALSSTAKGHPVGIVPVGLNFDHMSAFRSRVTTVFGRPIEYDAVVADYSKDESRAVRNLTERISYELRQLMVEANPRDDLSLVSRVDRLYASARGVSRRPEDQIARRRLIADGMETLRERDPEQLQTILARLRSYDASLARFGLRDRDVEQLNFDHMSAFRSRVTTVFGRPIEYDAVVADYSKDESRAVRNLTERISYELRQLMVEANPRDDLSLVSRVDRLYASARGVSRRPEDQIARRRLIADGMETLRERDPEQLQTILARLRSYDASLARFGLRDRDVEQRITSGLAWRFVIREGLLGVVLAPVAALSFVIFALPYWLTGRFGRRAPDLQSRATWKVVGGVVTYGLWIWLLATAAGIRQGWQIALGVAGFLTALAFIGLLAFERERAVLRTVTAFLALRQTPLKARAALRRQRVELASVLERVEEWIRD